MSQSMGKIHRLLSHVSRFAAAWHQKMSQMSSLGVKLMENVGKKQHLYPMTHPWDWYIYLHILHE